ncbi:MAG TPA: hypothetical protein VNA20_03005 [Frankiaceae bacterium]|nr:hypothetical protein [Frankiaceae bacterium]
MRERTLSLKKESLVELTSAELDRVVGASGLTCFACHNSDFQQCLTGVGCLLTDSC